MLFEYTKCKKCGHINSAYKNICAECKSYLRERIVNIDLWNTIQLIIEDPVRAFKRIIFSEHKNFIVFITFFIALKNLITVRFLSIPDLGLNGVRTSFIFSLILMSLITLLLLISLSSVQSILYRKKAINLRLKDIFAVNAYSFIPYLFGLIFIFPVELIVLGEDIFSNNPYSFQIKPLITFLLIGFEFLTIFWSFYLIHRTIFLITSKRFFSIFITSIYFIIWSAALYLSSKIIFTI
jgi:hypothetical protein